MFKFTTKFEIGLHAHNNLKKHSTHLHKIILLVDATITGMGRGPGNLKTEDIIKYTSQYKSTKNLS